MNYLGAQGTFKGEPLTRININRQTDREKEMQTDRQIDTNINKHINSNIYLYRYIGRHLLRDPHEVRQPRRVAGYKYTYTHR